GDPLARLDRHRRVVGRRPGGAHAHVFDRVDELVAAQVGLERLLVAEPGTVRTDQHAPAHLLLLDLEPRQDLGAPARPLTVRLRCVAQRRPHRAGTWRVIIFYHRSITTGNSPDECAPIPAYRLSCAR